MEVDAITEMFQTSEGKYGVKYTTYIRNGDSKTFRNILSVGSYDDEVIVEEEECVGHVEKQIGTRLRNAKHQCGQLKALAEKRKENYQTK